MIRKTVTVGIIILFVSIAFAPSINFNIVKASNNNDLVEITLLGCGVANFQPRTVLLTRQQDNELRTSISLFQSRLDNATSKEEALSAFNQVTSELNKYGLLPDSKYVELIKKLITQQFSQSMKTEFSKKNFQNNNMNPLVDYITVNKNCLVYAHVQGLVTSYGLLPSTISLFFLLLWIIVNILSGFIGGPLAFLFFVIAFVIAFYSNVRFLRIRDMYTVCLGSGSYHSFGFRGRQSNPDNYDSMWGFTGFMIIRRFYNFDWNYNMPNLDAEFFGYCRRLKAKVSDS